MNFIEVKSLDYSINKKKIFDNYNISFDDNV